MVNYIPLARQDTASSTVGAIGCLGKKERIACVFLLIPQAQQLITEKTE